MPWFRIFKISLYTCLLITTYLFFIVKPTLSAFIESIGWLMLLGLLEYESTVQQHKHRMVLAILTCASYAIITTGLYGYIHEQQWIDVVNCSAWLCVCLVLFVELGWLRNDSFTQSKRITLSMLKGGLYAVIVACAFLWSAEAATFLDALDAWLWLLCFFVIEMNIIRTNKHQNIL
jgi:energy-converting hydrogenase Eha subunit C